MSATTARLWALIVKEVRQILHNRRLVVFLIVPSTVALTLFGFALSSDVRNLRVGVVDDDRSAQSRELVAAFGASGAFRLSRTYPSVGALAADLNAGYLDLGLIVPYRFERDRERGQQDSLQILIDGTNANTARLAGGYAALVVASDASRGAVASIAARVALLYNQGLQSSWFMVTGLMGALPLLVGTSIAAGAMVTEKEAGTVDQLLMTPAAAWEIIVAKMGPLFVLLMLSVAAEVIVATTVFGTPFLGDWALFGGGAALLVASGIGLGMLISTLVASQQQAQLITFFINPPFILLSGALTPIEALPSWLIPIAHVNPVFNFATIVRGVMLKGAPSSLLLPNTLALILFATLVVSASVWRFSRQLA